MNHKDNIAILLCTYNGEKYLKSQLDSIIAQSYENWTIHASDDGSNDKTLEILEEYFQLLGTEKIKVYSGPKKGFSKNFFFLIKNKNVKASYYAFSDQDDIWDNSKLQRALESSVFSATGIPSLYCGRTRYIDDTLSTIGLSPLFKKTPSFKNALVQSIAGGNTMVMNEAFKKILEQTDTTKLIVSHDWWCYLLITAIGGRFFYDPIPALGYRQHAGNLVGANSSFRDRVTRFEKLLSGTFSSWNDANLNLLLDFQNFIVEENLKTIELFECSRKSKFLDRLLTAKRSGIYRQTLFGNFGLALAYVLKKV